MTVWVEEALWPRGKHVCGHLLSDSLDELHAMAEAVDLKGKYFLGHAVVPHYSIPEYLIDSVIAAGAVKLGMADRAMVLQRVWRACTQQQGQHAARKKGDDPIPRRRKSQATLFTG